LDVFVGLLNVHALGFLLIIPGGAFLHRGNLVPILFLLQFESFLCDEGLHGVVQLCGLFPHVFIKRHLLLQTLFVQAVREVEGVALVCVDLQVVHVNFELVLKCTFLRILVRDPALDG